MGNHRSIRLAERYDRDPLGRRDERLGGSSEVIDVVNDQRMR